MLNIVNNICVSKHYIYTYPYSNLKDHLILTFTSSNLRELRHRAGQDLPPSQREPWKLRTMEAANCETARWPYLKPLKGGYKHHYYSKRGYNNNYVFTNIFPTNIFQLFFTTNLQSMSYYGCVRKPCCAAWMVKPIVRWSYVTLVGLLFWRLIYHQTFLFKF